MSKLTPGSPPGAPSFDRLVRWAFPLTYSLMTLVFAPQAPVPWLALLVGLGTSFVTSLTTRELGRQFPVLSLAVSGALALVNTWVAGPLVPAYELGLIGILTTSFRLRRTSTALAYHAVILGGILAGEVLLGQDAVKLVSIAGVVGVISWLSLLLLRVINAQRAAIESSQAQVESLLFNILPEPIANRLRSGEGVVAESFPAVSVVFADIVGFTVLSKEMRPEEVVAMLDDLFRGIDIEARRIGIEKIKTIGDCYMAVAGIPEPCSDHADRALALGRAILRVVSDYNTRKGTSLQVRIGINSGPVVAGVIGHHKYIYDLWGDAVNTASRMESHGVPGAIMVTNETKQALKEAHRFHDHGIKEIKGKGPMQTWVWAGA